MQTHIKFLLVVLLVSMCGVQAESEYAIGRKGCCGKFKKATVTGLLTAGTVDVIGDLTVGGCINSTCINITGATGSCISTPCSIVSGDSTVGGSSTVAGGSSVGGDSTVGGSVTVAGGSAVGGNSTVGGSSTVAGGSAVGGLLTVAGGAAIAAGGNSLTVNASCVNVSGCFSVNGSPVIGATGNTGATGATGVTGATGPAGLADGWVTGQVSTTTTPGGGVISIPIGTFPANCMVEVMYQASAIVVGQIAPGLAESIVKMAGVQYASGTGTVLGVSNIALWGPLFGTNANLVTVGDQIIIQIGDPTNSVNWNVAWQYLVQVD